MLLSVYTEHFTAILMFFFTHSQTHTSDTMCAFQPKENQWLLSVICAVMCPWVAFGSAVRCVQWGSGSIWKSPILITSITPVDPSSSLATKIPKWFSDDQSQFNLSVYHRLPSSVHVYSQGSTRSSHSRKSIRQSLKRSQGHSASPSQSINTPSWLLQCSCMAPMPRGILTASHRLLRAGDYWYTIWTDRRPAAALEWLSDTVAWPNMESPALSKQWQRDKGRKRERWHSKILK